MFHLLILSLDFFFFLWVHWISFNSFTFIFLHLILSTTSCQCYKFRESWLIRNMLFPLGVPALCSPLDFSNEDERSCGGHTGVPFINFIVCPFIPQTSPSVSSGGRMQRTRPAKMEIRTLLPQSWRVFSLGEKYVHCLASLGLYSWGLLPWFLAATLLLGLGCWILFRSIV